MKGKNRYIVDPSTIDATGMVSASQLTSFMGCQKKWSYNYQEGLVPRVERPFLTIGKLCHAGFQDGMMSYADNGDIDVALAVGVDAINREYDVYMDSFCFLEEELPEFENTVADAIRVFNHAWYDFEPWRYEVLKVVNSEGKVIPALELHFVVPCAGSKGMRGYIDAILREKDTGFTWCTDYKFRKSFEDPSEEAFSIQNAIYNYACVKMGIDITGTHTWQHSNVAPSIPSVNKNGTVSRAKIKTTWEIYKEVCEANGQDPSDYADEMVPKLNEIEWSRSTKEYRNIFTTEGIWKDIVVSTSKEVKKVLKRTGPPLRSMFPWNCKICQYKELCQAELRGYDVDYLRTALFRTRVKPTDKNILDTEPSEVV